MDDSRTVSVSWYNAQKGFGFVSDGNEDIFLHKSSLEYFGLERLEPDDELRVTVTQNKQGAVIDEIQAVIRPPQPDPETVDAPGADEQIYRVKFFDPGRGYGFCVPMGGNAIGEDVFFHARDMRNSNIRRLEQGQMVVMKVQQSERGLVATKMRLLIKN